MIQGSAEFQPLVTLRLFLGEEPQSFKGKTLRYQLKGARQLNLTTLSPMRAAALL